MGGGLAVWVCYEVVDQLMNVKYQILNESKDKVEAAMEAKHRKDISDHPPDDFTLWK